MGRLAAGTRDRDWLAVGLELGVVVIGIFLGLQANAWNTHRQQKSQEQEYLALLQRDVDQMISDFAEVAGDAGRRRRVMTAALRALQVGDLDADASLAVEASLLTYQIAPPVRYRDATYSEMVSSGALARMEDLALKQEIVATFSFVRLMNQSIERYRTSIPVVDGVLWRSVSYGIGHDNDEDLTVRFDAEALSENEEARNAFVEMIDIQRDTQETLGDAIYELRALSTMLADRVGPTARP